jgi:hypothetical protein
MDDSAKQDAAADMKAAIIAASSLPVRNMRPRMRSEEKMMYIRCDSSFRNEMTDRSLSLGLLDMSGALY